MNLEEAFGTEHREQSLRTLKRRRFSFNQKNLPFILVCASVN